MKLMILNDVRLIKKYRRLTSQCKENEAILSEYIKNYSDKEVSPLIELTFEDFLRSMYKLSNFIKKHPRIVLLELISQEGTVR